MTRDAGAEAIDVLHTFAAAVERGDAEAAAACFAPDAIYEEPPRFRFDGQDAIAAFIRDFAARHTDVRFEIIRSLANPNGTLLAAEWCFAHTRTTDGAHASYAGMSFVTLAGGRIAHWRGYSIVR
jgi:limonene-1,2-epoxide hydrolase